MFHVNVALHVLVVFAACGCTLGSRPLPADLVEQIRPIANHAFAREGLDYTVDHVDWRQSLIYRTSTAPSLAPGVVIFARDLNVDVRDRSFLWVAIHEARHTWQARDQSAIGWSIDYLGNSLEHERDAIDFADRFLAAWPVGGAL